MKLSTCYIFLLGITATLLLSSCHNTLVGAGDIIEKVSYQDSTATINFTEIEVKADCNVYLSQDTFTEVTVSGYENLVPHVNSHKDGNKYIIELAADYVFDNSNIFISITTPLYTKISLSSQSSIVGIDSIVGNNIEIVNNSSGSISLFGDMNTVVAYSAGPGLTRLCALQADTVTAVMLGSGILSTKPINKLNAQIQGSGQVQYIGSPAITFSITGSGSLFQTLGCY